MEYKCAQCGETYVQEEDELCEECEHSLMEEWRQEQRELEKYYYSTRL